VTRNYSEKCINSILDHVSSSSNMELLQEFYETTLAALEEAKNERLWFKTNLKLCKLWFDMREYARMARLLKLLHKSCQLPDGTDDQKKGTQLLEVSSSICLPKVARAVVLSRRVTRRSTAAAEWGLHISGHSKCLCGVYRLRLERRTCEDTKTWAWGCFVNNPRQ
jgi:hypothetical protein